MKRSLFCAGILLLCALSQGCATAEYHQRREQALLRYQNAQAQADLAIAEGRAADALMWGLVAQEAQEQIPPHPVEVWGRALQGFGEGMQQSQQQHPVIVQPPQSLQCRQIGNGPHWQCH